MITIVIASADEKLQSEVKKNIQQTVGCICEIIVFNNSCGSRSISSIYNEGAKQAKYDIICFMHEDVAFKTVGWGNIVIQHFDSNKKLGLLGIAGSSYKSVTPSGWFAYSHVVEMEHSNIVQSYKYAGEKTVCNYRNPSNTNPAKVAVVDGVWMCTSKEIAMRFSFDEQTFQRFHGYDIDFSLSVGQHYDVNVTYDILLHHYSDGNFDDEWMKETIKLHDKWSQLLPVYTIELTSDQIKQIEKQNFKYWIKQLQFFGFPIAEAFKTLHRTGVAKAIGIKYYLKYHYRIISSYYFKKPSAEQSDKSVAC